MPFHTVVGVESGTPTIWQAELLAWSFKRAGETGPLTFIEAGGHHEFDHGDTFETVNYRSAGHDDYPRKIPGDEYPPYNRPYGLRDWLEADGPREDTLLIVDCDFAWFEPFRVPAVTQGHPWAQTWGGNQYMRWHREDHPGTQAFGVPLIIHRADLAEMLPRWIERTHAYRDVVGIYKPWMCEMYGMAMAAQIEGLTFTLGDFDADTFVHYFPYRDGLKWHEPGGLRGFNKFYYRPWEPVPVEGPPLSRRFAELVNEYAGSRCSTPS